MTRTVGPIDLNDEELRSEFDIADARVNLAGRHSAAARRRRRVSPEGRAPAR